MLEKYIELFTIVSKLDCENQLCELSKIFNRYR